MTLVPFNFLPLSSSHYTANFTAKLFNFLLFLVLFLLTTAVMAKPIPMDKIPPSLLTWVDWVKYEHPELECPIGYADEKRYCVWPGELEIRARESGALFQQKLTMFTETEVRLPGDRKHWPLKVTSNDESLVVVAKNGYPYALFEPGQYVLKGEFNWQELPASMSIAPGTGIVRYYLNDVEVRLPQIRNASLWLRDGKAINTEQASQDKLNIEVYRLVVDGHPLTMTTYMQVEVSGKQREVVLGKPILHGFEALSIESTLPAKLESDGSLRAQLRPGSWFFQVKSRYPDNITNIAYEFSGVDRSWPSSEVWVYRASPKDRQTEIEGVRQIDPRQVRLPSNWAGLPAYEIKADSEFKIKVNRRGDPQPEPDSLTLTRDYWLDFDGQGFTIKDQIFGKMTSDWRLAIDPRFDLGRVTIDGKSQFITRLNVNDRQGVEVRRGQLNMTAESRFEQGVSEIPATGWGRDFQQVNAKLHLPPGYQVMAVTGVDNVPASWIQRWTLYDIFLVLIISLGVGKLWGWKWTPVAIITSALIWHEYDAPKMIWLFLLAIIALLRVVPEENRFYQFLKALRVAGLVLLIIITLPFIVQQAREAIYPQLEPQWNLGMQTMPYQQDYVMPQNEMQLDQGSRVQELSSALVEPAKRSVDKLKSLAQSPSLQLEQIDPNATIQTGPGLPSWNWRTVNLNWNGPVAAEQNINILLIGPLGSMILSFVSIVLILVLVWRFMDIKVKKQRADLKVVFIALVAMFSTNSNAAEFPPQVLLEQLEQRLVVPETEAPRATIPNLKLNYSANEYIAQFSVHSLEETAIPLPIDLSVLAPVNVLLDGIEVNHQLYRSQQNQLWLMVPHGQHQIELTVYLPQLEQVQIPLPLKPLIVTAEGEGWSIDGIDKNAQAQQQLSLSRQQKGQKETAPDELAPSVLPPFLQVERTIQFGLQWQVITRVTRVSPMGSPVSVQIPLVPSAAVVTDGVTVENNKVQVNISANQRQVSWRSRLQPTERLTLTAAANKNWIEVWRADIATIWHVDIEGIAPIHHQDSGLTWLPAWHPWPGETVSFNVQRPMGVAGMTTTIDNSVLTVKPGKRATDANLSLRLRSSQGGKQALTLPNDVELLAVKINGRTQPLRLEGNSLNLPIVPGQQSYEIEWRSNTGMTWQWQTPQISLGGASVNATIKVQPPRDRWTIWLSGPSLGPAVLFWGLLIILVLLAVILGRIGASHLPVGVATWLLLGLGLSQVSVFALALVAVWFFAMYFRMKASENPGFEKHWFNLLQILLVALTVITALVLLGAVQNGLLGQPAMLIQGNQSSAYLFNWYQDRVGSEYPQATVLSAPIWVYRALMLAWALWLAFSLLAWVKWGWQAFSAGGLWRNVSIKLNKPQFGKKKANADNPWNSEDDAHNQSDNVKQSSEPVGKTKTDS